MADLGMNARAWAIADACEASADERRIAVQRRPGGARLLDAGVQVPGGLAAGLALAEMCTGGLAHVSYVPLTIGGLLVNPGDWILADADGVVVSALPLG